MNKVLFLYYYYYYLLLLLLLLLLLFVELHAVLQNDPILIEGYMSGALEVDNREDKMDFLNY